MASEKESRIFQTLFVLLSAIAGAILLAAYMIYHYNPSGRYVAGYTILSPEVIQEIKYSDYNPQTGSKAKFVFHEIDFSYYGKNNELKHVKVDLKVYEKFYQLIASELSLQDVEDQVKSQFIQSSPILLLTVHSEGQSQSPYTKILQMIQFSESDYFRVQLMSSQQSEWAYFHQPDLYQKVINLFVKSE